MQFGMSYVSKTLSMYSRFSNLLEKKFQKFVVTPDFNYPLFISNSMDVEYPLLYVSLTQGLEILLIF